MNTNLKEISTFINKNNSYSDYNLVNDFLLNLNFTKINLKNNNLIGGTLPGNIVPPIIDPNIIPYIVDPNIIDSNIIDPNIPQIPQIPQLSNIEKLPDMYLQNPPYTSNQINTYTIKEGTILYHATSNKKGFDTNQLNIGQDKLINFFTPNFRLASDKIEGCSVDKQNGFIHVFRVVKDIPNIYVKLPYDIANDINTGTLANEFCSGNQNYYGIGFFYPKNNIEMFSNNPYQNQQLQQSQYSQFQTQILDNPEQYYSEFGLCNPKPYLEYLYSQRCQSLRKLSDPYRFN
jgi:hypothetical protein